MKNLMVSFSGGETSAFMAQWLKNHYKDLGYDNIVFVFANTGIENEKTLEFVDRCDSKFDLNVHWVESFVYQDERKGTGYQITNFENASRKGEPFESVIQKYGIPNQSYPHCTRELKLAPLNAFTKVYYEGEKYDSAIGIRSDEIDRVNANHKKLNLVYPLISNIKMTKPMINFYWKTMPFRLELKGYQGNCITCWKKSDKKLFQIPKENIKAFDFMDEMEKRYGRVGGEFREDETRNNRVFFRKNRTTQDILNESKKWSGIVKDDSNEYNYQIDLLGGDSCEVFSECNQ